MKTYTVLSPGAGASDAADPMDTIVIKEGFSWPAFLFPVLWAAFHRLWLVLGLYVAVAILVAVAGETINGPLPATAALGLQLLFALEANQLRRLIYARRGFRLVAVVSGGSLEEAEIRYFADARPGGSAPTASPIERAGTALTPGVPRQTGAGEVVGLFPSPGGNSK